MLGRGKTLALEVVDYGAVHHLIWFTAIDEAKETWCAPNPSLRIQDNWTTGRISAARQQRTVDNRKIARRRSARCGVR
ncbi:hypothetical protein QQS45_10115 [Alteriqipengyuania flavescens]|nr:hypothetical protein QQW98_10110 [Alteriqipengyuania flavescens]WJY23919.1 hypothetical protein QQS45_10115 [Alteriqipengyuania flavescens]